MSHHVERIPYVIAYANTSGTRDAYGGLAEMVTLDSILVKPEGVASETVLVLMHPVSSGTYLPIVTALAKAGHHIIVCNSRYRGADSALLMEKVVQDLGECLRDAKNRLGYRKVVLAGWSGGGSLSMYYQQQAAHPTVTAAPSGDGPDLTTLDLIPADAILLMAAHISRHHTLTECMDPSIRDESDPADRDPELDLYHPDNPNQPPYSPEFVARYRQAQHDRNRRITAWVEAKLAAISASDRPQDEFCFVVHGTMADPTVLDPTLDPNDRTPGESYLGEPQEVNFGAFGLARFSTLRSWLSQWSVEHARGDAVACGPDIEVPTLVLYNAADNVCTPAHGRRIYAALGCADKELHEIPGANHYYLGADQREPLTKAVGLVDGWLRARDLGPGAGQRREILS